MKLLACRVITGSGVLFTEFASSLIVPCRHPGVSEQGFEGTRRQHPFARSWRWGHYLCLLGSLSSTVFRVAREGYSPMATRGRN